MNTTNTTLLLLVTIKLLEKTFLSTPLKQRGLFRGLYEELYEEPYEEPYEGPFIGLFIGPYEELYEEPYEGLSCEGVIL